MEKAVESPQSLYKQRLLVCLKCAELRISTQRLTQFEQLRFLSPPELKYRLSLPHYSEFLPFEANAPGMTCPSIAADDTTHRCGIELGPLYYQGQNFNDVIGL